MRSLFRFLFSSPQGPGSILFIRLAVGLIFFTQGILKYIYPQMGVERFTKIGFPHPYVTAHFVGDILVSGKLRGVPHETLLYEGSLWPTLERLIKEHEIDLVVTGTHGRGELKKVVIGSVAEEVFRQAACAVLTVGPLARKQAPREVELNDILYATDFGPGAAQYAFSLAQEHGARLSVLHVVEETKAHTREGEERLRQLNVARMKQFMPAESENWCKVEFRVALGAAVEEILGEARETNADLIIMGAKTSKAFPGHAPLTIAYNVVAKAMCPVLTVRG